MPADGALFFPFPRPAELAKGWLRCGSENMGVLPQVKMPFAEQLPDAVMFCILNELTKSLCKQPSNKNINKKKHGQSENITHARNLLWENKE
ncbi:hypothetical protein TELCIR_00103 [Teladorsagia circumcincta]|uniref:Uncharacterized protein n=1 Tax=Teladorsagia circumcincta TaxID=45464 RepID=A0A2G9V702_TELCI|nr:hypothetical protein TELCIR_00103 [Teladorsagia circumcincta]